MDTETKESEIIYHSPVIRSWPNEGYFIIPEVNYQGKTKTCRLFEQMTPAMNQERLAEFYETEKQKGNPHPTDAPLIWAIAAKGYEFRNENPINSEKLRQFLKQGFRKYPNTLTTIIYDPSENDTIIHNYKTSDQYSMNGKVVGPDGLIDKVPNADVLRQILGTKEIAKINEVFQWINETNAYIWRLNSKPPQKVERVAGFYAGDSGLYLSYGNLRDVSPAFRVLNVD